MFVHARNATVRTALQFREIARNRGDINLFLPEQSASYGGYLKQVIINRLEITSSVNFHSLFPSQNVLNARLQPEGKAMVFGINGTIISENLSMIRISILLLCFSTFRKNSDYLSFP